VPNRIDLTGRRIGRWTVLMLAKTRYFGKHGQCSRAYWSCRCDCGTFSEVPAFVLQKPQHSNISCGCYSVEILRVRNRRPGAAFRKLFARYVYGAKKRGFEFLLSEEEFRNLVIGGCHYCGTEARSKTPPRPTGEDFLYSGIDRLDPSKGYTIENCVSCCTTCNFMKTDLSFDDFLRQCRLVAAKYA
jgi:hypothetical protein